MMGLSWLLLLACTGAETVPLDSPTPSDTDTDTGTAPVSWPTSGTVLDNAWVVDATGGRTAAVIVTADLVWAVTDPGQDWPEHLEVRDLVGKTIMPGLIDSHVHIYDPGTTWWVGDLVADNLRATLAWGVTAVVDVAGPTVNFSLRDRIAEGSLLGPRLRATGPFLTVEGSHPCETLWYRNLCLFVDVDGVAAAEGLVEAGADLLKVALVDNSFFGDPTPRLDLGDLAAIADLGVEVVAHIAEPQDELDAASLVNHLAHPVFAEPREPTTLDPTPTSIATTVSAFSGIVDVMGGADLAGEEWQGLPTAVRNSWEWLQQNPEVLAEGWVEDSAGWAQQLRENLAVYREVHPDLLVVGTDAGYWLVAHGTRMHTEMAELVDAGWTPLEALSAATHLPAQAWGWKDAGLVAAGYRADLLVLGSNPLADIANTRDIEEVWLAGVSRTPETWLATDLWQAAGDGFCLDDRDCQDTCNLIHHTCGDSCPTPYMPVNDCGPDDFCAPVDGLTTTREGVCHPGDGCDWRLQDCGSDTYKEICVPADQDSNFCWPAGPRGPGESCNLDDPDLYCDSGSLCGTSGRCLAICDPDGVDCDQGNCVWQKAGGENWYGLCL